jgi:hypothetical protein
MSLLMHRFKVTRYAGQAGLIDMPRKEAKYKRCYIRQALYTKNPTDRK